jgi:hypothetical protein
MRQSAAAMRVASPFKKNRKGYAAQESQVYLFVYIISLSFLSVLYRRALLDLAFTVDGWGDSVLI